MKPGRVKRLHDNRTMRNNINNLTSTALMAAIICIAGPIVIPIGMVPVSFVNMAIYLAIILLDQKKATISILIYLLIGFVGIPVFAGFTAGVGKLFGPTGGYLLAYPVVSLVAGRILEKGKDSPKVFRENKEPKNRQIQSHKDIEAQKSKNIFRQTRQKRMKARQVIALVAGTVFLYFAGTLWLMYQSNLGLMAAFSTGVLPFVVFDAIKIYLFII